jgi:hypothetical protein
MGEIMRGLDHWTSRCRGLAVLAAGALAVGVAGLPAPAGASLAARPVTHTKTQDTTGVASTPAAGTPSLTKTGTQEVIKQIVQCGDTMYAVGSFTSITQDKVAYPRQNVFSFSANPPYTITSWAPDVNNKVNSITFNGSGCADAYIGGWFTSVNGTAVKYLAEIDTVVGNVIPTFGTTAAGGYVNTLQGADGHILAGGAFTSVNGGKDAYLASLNPVTGDDDGFVRLHISGHYYFCNTDKPPRCTAGDNHTVIYNQQLSHGGTLDLVEGDFTSVGGLSRQEIFMVNLATDPATVTGWTSPQWDGSEGNLPSGYPYQCYFTEAFYIRDAAWSPDDQTVYIADTGDTPWNVSSDTEPRVGLCDAVAASPATQTSVLDEWINYSGCDSFYSVAADATTVYAAGHVRWAQNGNDCNAPGAGSIPDPGLWGVDAATGNVVTDTQGTAGLYSMSKANAQDMLATSAGLWIASTNRYGSDVCGGVSGHAGICFLPYPSS